MKTKTILVSIKVFINSDEKSQEEIETMADIISKDFSNYLRGSPQNNKYILGSLVEREIINE